jgi:hypothetical protein
MNRKEREDDLEREIRSHLDLEAEESGKYSAQRQFGNTTLIKEDVRTAWGWAGLGQFFQDIRYGLRQVLHRCLVETIGQRQAGSERQISTASQQGDV